MELTLHEASTCALSRARGAMPAAQLAPAHTAALARFPLRRRKAVRKLALNHPYLADLLLSFPAALYVMAHGRPLRTLAGQRLAIAGAPLKEVAGAVSLPLWTRRVPIEACRPALLLPLPSGRELSAKIVNLMPREGRDWGFWLEALSIASRVMDEAFALWVAREMKRYQRPQKIDGIATIALFAWYGAAERNAASRLIVECWHPRLSLPRAAQAARHWLDSLGFVLIEEPAAIEVPHPLDNTVGPYSFHPLGWGKSLVQEGAQMRNCLATYASGYARGSRVWSIRRDKETVADIELSFAGTNHGVPRLVQLHARCNALAPDEVWAAVYQWLARWTVQAETIAVGWPLAHDRAGAWVEVWRPFWEAKGFGPGLPYPIGVTPGIDAEQIMDGVQSLCWLGQRTN